jgi:hypothetical protein
MTSHAPKLMQLGMMVLGIIEDYLHSSARVAADGPEVAREKEETLSIELIGTMKHELAIPQTHSAKVANALASRVVVNNWLFHFARNPHATTRTM